jgi:CubicO group peptidase (beta-lactamase class C family)
MGGKYPASINYFPPGTAVGYSDLGMQIAGGIAEKVGGKPFNDLFLEKIAEPLGMKMATFTGFNG